MIDTPDTSARNRSGSLRREGALGARALLLLFALFAVGALFAVSGCKYSDVLTQHTEDPTAAVDETQEPTYVSNPDADLVMDLADLSIDSADDVNTQVATLPHYDPDAPDNGPTKQLVKSTETPHDEEAAEGDDDGEPDRDGQGEGEGGGESGTQSGGEAEGDGEGDGDPLSDDDSDEKDQSDEGGNAGDTVTVDPDGTNDDTSKGTVAAVGEYATIAQMLGGAGALAGCDQSWLDDCKAKGLFSSGGDELARVQVAFSGDGSQAGSCDVDALVNTIQPAVVLWDSTANVPALSEAERATLKEAGIEIQPVPHIGEQNTEDYAVTSAVTEVAGVLSGAAGLQYDPTDVLAKYVEFHDGALRGCYNANGGYSYKATDSSYSFLYQDTPLSGLNDSTTNRVTTVYVDEMKNMGSHATVSQTATTSSGTLRLEHDGESLDISDGVALSASTGTQSYLLIDYYLQLAGVMNNAYDTAQPESQGRRYILMPGNTADFGTSSNYATRLTGSAFFYNAGDATVSSNWHQLGDDGFNTVLVASEDIASAMIASAAKSNGLYNMASGYDVVVVPTGACGAWAAGHIDSFLLAPWAFRIQSADNLDAAASYASNFYSTYLRCADWQQAIANWDNARAAS